LLPLADAEQQALAAHTAVTLRNWKGLEVGRIQASPVLQQALAA
jgi:hypothetical protein